MPRTTANATPQSPAPPPYPPDALFRADGPFNPTYADDVFRILMRALPHDPDEPDCARNARMYGALCTLSGMAPRDGIEMMYAVAAIISFHAGVASFRIGMNGALPNGENSRHLTTAASAMRCFDSMIKGLERRQARPLPVETGPRDWSHIDPEACLETLADRLRGTTSRPGAAPIQTAARDAIKRWEDLVTEQAKPPPPKPEPVWTAEMVHKVLMDALPKPKPVEGVEPDGSIVVPENPTPEQETYMGLRIIRNEREKWAKEIDGGGKPRIPPVRPGDRIP